MRGPLVVSTLLHAALIGFVAIGLPALHEREPLDTRIVPVQFVRIDTETATPPGEERPPLPEPRPAARVAESDAPARPAPDEAREAPRPQEQRRVDVAEAPRPIARPAEATPPRPETPPPRPAEAARAAPSATETRPVDVAEASRPNESTPPAVPTTPVPRPEPRAAVPAAPPTVKSEAVRRPPPAPRPRPRALEQPTQVAERPQPEPTPPPAPRREPEPEPPRADDFAQRMAGAISGARSPAQPEPTPEPERRSPDMSRVAEAVGGVRQPGVRGGISSSQLTASELDALRRQLERCWTPPAGAAGAEELAVEVRVSLTPSGDVSRAEVVDQARMRREEFYRVAAESAIRAVLRCAPYSLPRASYANWQSLLINFDPKEFLG